MADNDDSPQSATYSSNSAPTIVNATTAGSEQQKNGAAFQMTHKRSPSAPVTSNSGNDEGRAIMKPFASLTRLFSGSERTTFLTTRPSSLPPKPPEEEERHRREYEDMIMKFKKKEMEMERKKAEARLRREHRILENKRVWTCEILPNWDKKKKERRTREIWWQGIPPSLRAKVWTLAINNDLHITKELYTIMLQQAERLKQAKTEKLQLGKVATVDLIPLDLPRTFPALAFYQPGGPLHQALREVLEAYVSYRPDIGYVQGMSYLAAVLLLYLDPYPAFVCLANLLNRPCQLVFYRLENDAILRYTLAFEYAMKEELYDLYNHFKLHNVSSEMFLLDWILTLYAKSLPIDIASRIWDVYLLEGDSFLFRAALGLLRMLKNSLLSMDLDGIMKLFGGLADQLSIVDEEELFENIQKVHLTPERFEQLFERAKSTPIHDV